LRDHGENGMANTINDRENDGDAQGGRRPRQAGKRPHKVEFRLTDEELSLLDDAARRSGRARGAFAAEAALAAARGGSAAGSAAMAEAVGELMRASGLVRRIGVNLNQAVARLNATGQRPGDLLPYARESMRRAEILTAAAEEVRKSLR
jgi:hypothetical protein